MKDKEDKKNEKDKEDEEDKKDKEREVLFLSWVQQGDRKSWMNLLRTQERAILWGQITRIEAFIWQADEGTCYREDVAIAS